MQVYLVDAFTTKRFEGNRAGVVLDADRLSWQEKQQIAAEIGASETAFVSSSSLADFKVEFFTPSTEVDFCGHATVATFYMLAELGKLRITNKNCDLTQETRAGILPVSISRSGGRTVVTMTQRAPEFAAPELSQREIAQALNINENHLDRRFPIALANTGNWHLMVAVNTKECLDNIKYESSRLSNILSGTGAITAHVFFADSQRLFYARNFCPTIGIPEDPATGAAAGAFGAYLVREGLLPDEISEIEIVQGEAMGRPGRIIVRTSVQNGHIEQVQVSGKAELSMTMMMQDFPELGESSSPALKDTQGSMPSGILH